MGYKSPFHFLPIEISATPLDHSVVQRAKKKLLAEFELQDSIAGFSKNDLLQWFDNLNAEELTYHKYIYENKPLLIFLEEGQVTPGDWIESLPNDSALQSFVFKEVQQQYDQLFTEAFRNSAPPRIKELSSFALPDIEKKGRYYYAGALNLLTANFHQLLLISRNWDVVHEPQLREFMSLPFFRLFPVLPPYFQAMRDEFAITLIHLAEQLCEEKFKQFQLAKDVALMSRAIGPSDKALGTIMLIEKKKILTKGNNEAIPEKKSKRGCVAWVILIFVLLNLLRILISFIS